MPHGHAARLAPGAGPRIARGGAAVEQGELRQRGLSRLCPPVHEDGRRASACQLCGSGSRSVNARFNRLLAVVARRSVPELTRVACVLALLGLVVMVYP